MSARIAPLGRDAARHIKVSGPGQTFRYERCEYPDCVVTQAGVGSLCERTACPSCGSGGANLSETEVELGLAPAAIRLQCTCGTSWVPRPTTSVRPKFASPEHDSR